MSFYQFHSCKKGASFQAHPQQKNIKIVSTKLPTKCARLRLELRRCRYFNLRDLSMLVNLAPPSRNGLSQVAAAWISVIRNNILKIHSVLAIHPKAVLSSFCDCHSKSRKRSEGLHLTTAFLRSALLVNIKNSALMRPRLPKPWKELRKGKESNLAWV